MQKFLYIFLLSALSVILVSCGGDDDATPTYNRRTVIAYITGDNNLSGFLSSDLEEMRLGSVNLANDCNLIAFVDIARTTPYIARIKNGNIEKVRQWDRNVYSTSPDEMLDIYQWIIAHYPADEYATIIEGHGTGAVVYKDTIATDLVAMNAYGYDSNGLGNGNDKWLNIPTLAKVFSHLPHMEYIFFDCCCLQTAEVAYEMRQCADYIISPVSETHTSGAPYKYVIPVISQPTENVGKAIIDQYASNATYGNACGVCISCVKTSEMEPLLTATRKALQSLYNGNGQLTLNTNHTIYYYRGKETYAVPIHHDMKALMKHNLSEKDFDEWLPYLERAVTYSVMAQPSGKKNLWSTSQFLDDGWYSPIVDFHYFFDPDTYTEHHTEATTTNHYDADHYGGISMIVPNSGYDGAISRGYTSVNTWMKDLLWVNKVGWTEMGW